MAVSLNTISVATPTRGTLSSKKGEAASYNVIPVKNATDTVAFTGSKKPHPVKTFLGALAVTFGLGAPSATMTSCDPIPDIDTTVVTPPKVDYNKNLSPLQIKFKNIMSPVFAMDSTEVGAIQQVRFNDGTTGQDVEYIIDDAKSTKDTIYAAENIYSGKYLEGQLKAKFYQNSDGSLGVSHFFKDGEFITNVKYTKDNLNNVFEYIDIGADSKYIKDKVAGQSLKYNLKNLDKPCIVKLVSKTMKAL